MTSKYAFEADPKKTSRARVDRSRVSYKNAIEIGRHIKGMVLKKAQMCLEDAVALKRPIPFKHFIKDQAHRKGAGMAAGRFPVKTAEQMLKLLKNAEDNADGKGLDTDKLFVKNVAACKAGKGIYRGSRGFGRRRAKNANIQVTLEERA